MIVDRDVTAGAAIICALAGLTEGQRQVVVGRYWRGESQQMLADRIGVTRSRVWQLEKQALERMRVELGPHRETLLMAAA